MATVTRRIFNSNPQRNAEQTWIAIVDLLTKGKQGERRDELLSVSGIVASIITDQYPKDYPIITTCNGPRTRIYCLYDDKAIEGDEANEDVLGYDPLQGEWKISFPCGAEDLGWVQKALLKHSKRIVARELTSNVDDETQLSNATKSLTLNQNGFLGI